jgi:hypothetical protein
MGPRKPAARHAVARAFKADQAGRRHPLALLDEAVEGRRHGHQGCLLLRPDLRDRPGQCAVRGTLPLFEAPLLEPGVQVRQVGEVRHQVQDQVAGVLHVLLDLTLLPTGRRIAELGREDVVAGHCQEPGVDLPRLAPTDPVHRCPRVVVDAPARDPAEHPECMPVGIKQHLVRLQQVGPEQERAAVRELDVGDLELRVLPGDRRPVLAPVELERLPGLEEQRYEGATSCGLLFALTVRPPLPREGRDPAVGAGVAQGDQIRVELLQGPPLLAGLPRFSLQPGRQLVGKGVQFARPLRHPERRLHRSRP